MSSTALYSWDSDSYDGEFCGETTEGLVNAGFCEQDDTIGWDRAVLMPSLRAANGDMAITMVLAHEYGHAIQKMATMNPRGVPAMVAEQQADCLAGVYLRWVAEGKSPRFTLSTGEGLNNLLAAMMISFRDPLLSSADKYDTGDEHGSAFERISAFQFGFTEGTAACAAINIQEIKQRRGIRGGTALQPERRTAGHRDVGETDHRGDEHPVRPEVPPQLSFDAASASSCPDARPSPPASYCPAGEEHHHRRSSGVATDGHATTEGIDGTALQGDNTAYWSWCPGTCWPSSTSTAGWHSTPPRPLAHRLPDRGGHPEDVDSDHHAGRGDRVTDRR